MPRRVTRRELAEIEATLAEGPSRRKAGRLMRRSRGTIALIAAGRHRLQLCGPDAMATTIEEDLDPDRPYIRCACGHKVQLPCQVCLARAERLLSKILGRWRLLIVDLPASGLDLKPEHAARYERIREKRERLGRPLIQGEFAFGKAEDG